MEIRTPLDKLINILLFFTYREPNHTLDTQTAFYLIWAADRKQMRYSGTPLIDTDYEIICGYHLIPTVVRCRLDFVTDMVAANKFGSYQALCDYNPDMLSETNRRIMEETYQYFKGWNNKKFVSYFKRFPEFIDDGIIDKKMFFKENRKGFFKDDREALKLAEQIYLETLHK